MIDSDVLDYVILKLESYSAIALPKREENKINKTIDILIDIKNNRKVSKKDKSDALFYAFKKINDFSLDYDTHTKEYEEIDKICDALYRMIKNL